MDSKKVFPFFWVFVFFLLQNAAGFFIIQRTPVLLLLAILYYALSEGAGYGALLGAFAGLLLEVFGQGRLGCEVLVFSAAGYLFGKSGSAFFRESLFSQFLFPLIAFYFMALSRLLLYQFFSGSFDFSLVKATFMPYDALVVLASAPVLFFFLRKVSR